MTDFLLHYTIKESFDIINFPHMSSNIPSKPAYGVYISQLIRIGRICEAFAERHYKLTSRLIKQGFWYNKLCIAFKKFSLNHMDIFSKYKVSLREHIHEGICLPLVAKNTLNRNIYSRHT